MATHTTRHLPTRWPKCPLFWVRVTGESAWPMLVPGKRYIASSVKRPSIGSFVVFRHPISESGFMVKRVVDYTSSGYTVASSVPWGTAGSMLGTVSRSDIVGTVLFK